MRRDDLEILIQEGEGTPLDPGSLPKGVTLADLGRTSVRWNALVCDLLHRIGFIGKAGTGIRRIRDEARELYCPEPEFEANGLVTVIFRPNPEVRAEAKERPMGRVATEVAKEVTTEVRLSKALSGEMTRQDLRDALGFKNDEHFRKTYLSPATQAGLIEMTIPDKPRSRNQCYRLTPAGREFPRQTEGKQ